jgi:DNA polymerase-3 subunit alpha
MCNLLSSEIHNNDHGDKLNSYSREAKQMGVSIARPNINLSGVVFKIEEKTEDNGKKRYYLRAPMTILKGVGEKAVKEIVKHQPYANLKDFVRKVDNRKVTSKVFEMLVSNGCMDGEWKSTRESILSRVDEMRKEVKEESYVERKTANYLEQFHTGSIFD